VARRIIRQETEGIKGMGEVRQIAKVPSASRPGHFHYVDPEQGVCSCEGFHFTGHCRHLDELRTKPCLVCQGLGTFVSYPKLCVCAACEGTGLVKGAA
jgi:hypothetical protein